MKHITMISVPAKATDTATTTTYDQIVAFIKDPAGVTTDYITDLLAKVTATE